MKAELRKQVYYKYDGHCAYCGKEIQYREMQVDHLHPQALSHFKATGRDINGNLIMPDPDRFENLMPSCRRCNHYKRAHTIEQFRDNMRTIQKRLMKIYIFKVAVDYGIVEVKPFSGTFYFEHKEG